MFILQDTLESSVIAKYDMSHTDKMLESMVAGCVEYFQLIFVCHIHRNSGFDTFYLVGIGMSTYANEKLLSSKIQDSMGHLHLTWRQYLLSRLLAISKTIYREVASDH